MTENEHAVDSEQAYRAELDAQFDSVMRHIPDIEIYKGLPFEEYLNTHPDAQYLFSSKNIDLFMVFVDEAKVHFEKESKKLSIKPDNVLENLEISRKDGFNHQKIKVVILKHRNNPEFVIEITK